MTMNIQNKDKKMSFVKACREGKIEDVRHLCQKKYLEFGWADIHCENDYGFRMACESGHLEIVKYLLTSHDLIEAGHAFADLHVNNEEGFRWACNREHWNVVRWLVLDYGIEKTPAMNEIIKDYSQAQKYFQVREELKELKNVLHESRSNPGMGKKMKL